jgi:type IV pilus assembly protein PilW
LLIAMTLSLVIMAGILALLTGTKQTFTLQQAVSRVQSDGNAAMMLLEGQIRTAGYPEDSLVLETGVVGKDGKGGNYAISADAGQAFSETVSGDSSLILQFEAPYDGFFNCAGEVFSVNDTIAVRIALSDIDGDGIDSLTCQGISAPAVLVDDVTNLQFEYGELSSGATAVPVEYKAYSDVGNTRNVVAVRVSFDVNADHPSLQARTFSTTVPIRNQVHQ